ncbi:MAG: DinB family protein [Anaerolineales bacterium]
MNELQEYRIELLNRLERQPEEFSATLAALPEAQWFGWHVADGRSVHLVMAHVRDLEALAFLPRFRRVLTEADPILEPFPSHNWSTEQYNHAEPLAVMLADFARARAETVNLVHSLHPGDWSRRGFHPPSGWRTAQWWAERMYTHAQRHLTDIRRGLGRLKTRPIVPLSARGRSWLPPGPEREDDLT